MPIIFEGEVYDSPEEGKETTPVRRGVHVTEDAKAAAAKAESENSE